MAQLRPAESASGQVDPNWVVLDDVEFAAVDTRPPSPWEQVISLIGGAMALGVVGAMMGAMVGRQVGRPSAPAIAKGVARKG